MLPYSILKCCWTIFRVLLPQSKGSLPGKIATQESILNVEENCTVLLVSFFSFAELWRSMTKAAGSPATMLTCAIAWRRTAWAASTPAPSVTPTSVALNAAATAAGCTMPSSLSLGRSSVRCPSTFRTRSCPRGLIGFFFTFKATSFSWVNFRGWGKMF